MISFRLYERNGGALIGLLAEPTGFELSVEFNEVGAMRFEYPVEGVNADQIAVFREIAAIDANGNEIKNGRYVITGISQDRSKAKQTISVTARSILWRLDTALAYPDGGVSSGEVSRFFDENTAGYVMKTVIDDAKTRGALYGITYDFTATADSNSISWPDTITAEYPARTSILQVYRSLTDFGLAEIETQGRAIRMCVLDGIGSDKTSGANPIVLRSGFNITEAPEELNAEKIAGVALVEGDEGVIFERTNSAAVTAYGRLETSFTASGLDDPFVIQPLADNYLDNISDPSRQLTLGLSLQDAAPQPFVDFTVGDYVYTATNTGLEKVRVRQVTVSMSGGSYSATATLGDRIYEADVRNSRRLAALTSGSVTLGNGGLPTTTVTVVTDTVAPSAPSSLTGSSSSYLDADIVRSSVALTWTAPTTNADATALTDLAGYEVQFRKSGASTWEFAANSSSASATISRLEPGIAYQFQVIAIDTSGNRSAVSNTYSVTTTTVTSYGSIPSTPVLTSRLGTLSVYWNGLNSTGGAMGAGFNRVLVHASTTSGFTPSSATAKGQLNGSGTFVLTDLTYNTTYYVKLVAYTTNGVASTASSQASASITPLVNTDLIAKSLSTWPFQDGTVDTAALANLSISASKLIDGAVVQAKIAANAIGADQIAANAVVAGKIAADAVTSGTIAALSITAGKIASNAITADKIEAGAITAVKIDATAIDGKTITGSTIRTSSSASRVEMNSSGLFVYNSGSPVVSLNASGSASFTGTVNATNGTIGGFTINNNPTYGAYMTSGSLYLYGAYTGGSNVWGIIDLSRGASFNGVQSTSSASDAFTTSGGITAIGSSDLNRLNVTSTMSITAGYGVTTDWSPNTDSGGSLGQSGRRWTRLYATTTTISTSDARLKTDVRNSELGLDFINALNPVSFKWIVGDTKIKRDENDEPIVTGTDENDKPIFEIETRPGVRRHFGFLAQEVKAALDASGAEDFAGWVQNDLSDPESGQSLSYEQFIAPLVKAVQELSARVNTLESRA